MGNIFLVSYMFKNNLLYFNCTSLNTHVTHLLLLLSMWQHSHVITLPAGCGPQQHSLQISRLWISLADLYAFLAEKVFQRHSLWLLAKWAARNNRAGPYFNAYFFIQIEISTILAKVRIQSLGSTSNNQLPNCKITALRWKDKKQASTNQEGAKSHMKWQSTTLVSNMQSWWSQGKCKTEGCRVADSYKHVNTEGVRNSS